MEPQCLQSSGYLVHAQHARDINIHGIHPLLPKIDLGSADWSLSTSSSGLKSAAENTWSRLARKPCRVSLFPTRGGSGKEVCSFQKNSFASEVLLTVYFDFKLSRASEIVGKFLQVNRDGQIGIDVGKRQVSHLTDPLTPANSSDLQQSKERPLAKAGWTRPPSDPSPQRRRRGQSAVVVDTAD